VNDLRPPTCGACGAPLAADALFCHRCGARIVGAAASRAARIRANDPEASDLAKRLSSLGLLQEKEWLGTPAARLFNGPIPEIRAETPFFNIVFALIAAREQGRDVRPSDIDELSRGFVVSLKLNARLPYDIQTWNVVADPAGFRLQPEAVLGFAINEIGNTLLYQMSWQFDIAAISSVRRPFTIALYRPPLFSELRYTFPYAMR
jgi:hypothetical protein